MIFSNIFITILGILLIIYALMEGPIFHPAWEAMGYGAPNVSFYLIPPLGAVLSFYCIYLIWRKRG
jgi:hypothetical protein